MFRTIIRQIKRIIGGPGRPSQQNSKQMSGAYQGEAGAAPLTEDLRVSLGALRGMLRGCDEVVFREFDIGQLAIRSALIYLENAVYRPSIHQVLESLMQETRMLYTSRDLYGEELYNVIRKQALNIGNVEDVDNLKSIVDFILEGEAVLIIDGLKKAMALRVAYSEARGIEEPLAEAVVRGPREGFTENVATNIVMVRRRLKSDWDLSKNE